MKYVVTAILFLNCLLIASLSALPAQIMLVRHAEKPALGNGLSLKGKERAAAFVPYFLETAQLTVNGAPVAIYATGSSKADSSQLCVLTVTSLAEQLKLKIRNSFEKENYKKMVEEIKTDPAYHGRNVLICWDHAVMPEIARAFGALQTPNRWPGEAFDRTWIINFSSTGRPSFQNLPQRLIYGDSFN